MEAKLQLQPILVSRSTAVELGEVSISCVRASTNPRERVLTFRISPPPEELSLPERVPPAEATSRYLLTILRNHNSRSELPKTAKTSSRLLKAIQEARARVQGA